MPGPVRPGPDVPVIDQDGCHQAPRDPLCPVPDVQAVDQDGFHRALRDPLCPVPDGLTDGLARPAGRRFDVYRNNVASSLTRALHTAFPTLANLLGPDNMDGLAGLYLRAHPPETPLMMHYGAAMPDFVAAMDQLAHLPYLADIARLDLAMRRSYHAADAAPIDAATLAGLSPEALMSARMSLAPPVQLLRSAHPVHDIWAFAMAGGPKPRPGAQDIIILRPDFDPAPHLLPPGAGALIEALAQGADLASAQARAETDHPGFDPGPAIALLLQGAAITTLTPKDPQP